MKDRLAVCLLVITLLLPWQITSAQSLSLKIDSLVRLSKSQTGAPLAATYIEIGKWHWERKDYAKAYDMALMANAIAAEYHADTTMVRAMLLQGRVELMNNHRDEALKKFTAAKKRAESLHHKKLILGCWQIFSIYYQNIGDYKRSLAAVDKVIALAREVHDDDRLIFAIAQKAAYFYIDTRFDEAIKMYEALMPLLERHPEISPSFYYSIYGMLLRGVGNLEKARHYQQKIVVLAPVEHDTSSLIRAHSELGILHKKLNEYEKSLASFREMGKLSLLAHDTANFDDHLSSLFGLHNDVGQLTESIQYLDSLSTLRRLYPQLKKKSNYHHLALYYALTYLLVHDNDRALQSIADARRQFYAHYPQDEPDRQNAFLRNLAFVYGEANMMDSAYKYNVMAYQHAKPTPAEEIVLYTQRAQIMISKRRLDSAQYYMNKVNDYLYNKNERELSVVDASREKQIAIRNTAAVDQYYLVAGSLEKELGHYEQAIRYLENGLYTDDFWMHMKIEPLLIACYEKTGRFADAVKASKRLLILKDSASLAQASYRQQQALARFQTLEKEKENITLHRDKKAQAVIISGQRNVIFFGGIGITLLIVAVSLALHFYFEQQKSNVALVEQHTETLVQKRKAEDAFRELQDTEAQLIQAEKMAGLGQLIAGIAHEINNPLNFVINGGEGMIANLAELKKEVNTTTQTMAEMEVLATTMRTGTTRMKSIVDSLLKISHGSQATFVSSNLRENIDLALQLIQTAIKTRDIRVNVHAEKTLTIECNSGEINQAFVNLLTNAIQSIPGNGRVDITLRETPERKVEILISDTGVGIPEKHITKIFDPFFTTKEVGKGTGLGLPITKKIIEKHHGRLTVTSTPGQGSTFCILLPFEQPLN